jgi:hypothetical protein
MKELMGKNILKIKGCMNKIKQKLINSKKEKRA